MSQIPGYCGNARASASRYQQIDLVGRIDGATPQALVAMLYAELGVALDVMARATTVHDTTRRLRQHERATSILHMLDAGLDHARGGDLARSLSGIYRQMRCRLIASRDGDPGAIIEVREGVASLAEAWAKIVA